MVKLFIIIILLKLVFRFYYIQFERGLWPHVLRDNGISASGHSFTDGEMDAFYDHFYGLMQKRLKK